jgi:hypothetical protein
MGTHSTMTLHRAARNTLSLPCTVLLGSWSKCDVTSLLSFMFIIAARYMPH